MNFIYTVFGWPLGWIMYVCYLIVKNYGLALILFTIITKALQLSPGDQAAKVHDENGHF